MINALTWNSVNVFGLQAVQLVIGIILARLLSPEMFGAIGVLFIFIGLGTVFADGGFGQGLIRKQHTDEKDFSTIFYLNLFISAVLYIVLYFTTPAVVSFFSQPTTLVTPARVLFLSIVFSSFYVIHQVKLTKELDYKSIAITNITSVLFSGICAVIAAFCGLGIWALVIQQVFFHLAKSITTPLFSRLKLKGVFSVQTIRGLWKFSIALLGQSTLNVIFYNIYAVLIGRFYPIRQVGYFTQANKYSETVNAATQGILSSSTFPIFSKIQDNTERLRAMVRKLSVSVGLITFPLVSLLIVAARPLIVTLITDKWLLSVPLFQLLVFANIFYPLYLININLLNARGKSKQALNLEIFKKTLIVLSIFVCFRFGIKAMLVGLAVANFLSYGVSMLMIKRSITHYLRHQLLDFLPVLFLSILCAIAVYPIHFIIVTDWLLLPVVGVVFAALYLALIRIFYPAYFREGMLKIKKKLSK